MSDIESNITPKESTLVGRIYIGQFSRQHAERFSGGTGVVDNDTGLFGYSFEHSKRVVGYKDPKGSLYILGDESIVVDKGLSPYGTDVNNLRTYYRATTDKMGVPPSTFSTGYYLEDNKWLIGVKTPTDDNIIPPKSISEWNYVNSSLENIRQLASRCKTVRSGDKENSILLSRDLKTTLTIYGESEIKNGRWIYNPVGYSKMFNDLITIANSMYEQWVASPDVGFMKHSETFIGNDNNKNYVFSNLIITGDFDKAIKYLDDGTIPDDAIYFDPTETPNGINGEDGGDPNNDSDGNNGSDHKDDIPLNTPPETAATMSNCHIYSLAKSQLDAFISDMWDFSWTELTTNMMTGIYNNLIDNVQSIRLMPFSGSDLGTISTVNGISCGWWTHTANVNKLTPDKSIKTAGTYELKKSFNGWADYSPYTSTEVYLPYLGWMDIDTNLFMGHTIKVEYTLDVLCGIITYYISCDKTFAMTKSAKVACDIPISLTSGIDVFSDIAKNVGGAVSNVANARPIGLVSGSAQVTTPKLVGDATESGKLWMPTKCAIRITRPAYTRASNYASRYGYPCYGSYKLSDLSGFTVIENYKSHYTKGIKKEEEDMIKSMMESGVYL